MMPSDFRIRFNRYIVECKSLSRAPNVSSNVVLIDTQWNVNKNDAAIVEPLTAF